MHTLDADYDQPMLLPQAVEDWISSDHPARFIREVVEASKLEALGFKIPAAQTGRPPYSRKLLLRVWLYAYWRKISSTRKIEFACREEMGFIWLCGNLKPDHSVLWRFFDENRQALREFFIYTVKVAIKLDLVGMQLQAIDGTKIQAACSGGGGFDKKALETLDEQLNKQILELEERIEQSADETGDTQLPEELANRKALQQKVQSALNTVLQKQTKHCSPHEPDARRMKCDDRNRFGYNAQATVDQKKQIIVAESVTNECNDTQQLPQMLEQTRQNLGVQDTTFLADGGYATSRSHAAAEQKQFTVLTPLPAGTVAPSDNPYHAANFRYDCDANVFICPLYRQIPFQRTRKKGNVLIDVYRSAKACNGCPAFGVCTTDRHGRTIDKQQGYEALQNLRARLDESAQRMLAMRARIVEPVFAQIKHNLNFRRWTHYGLDAVNAQWALLCSTWNLKKIYQAWLKTAPSSHPRPAHHRLITLISVILANMQVNPATYLNRRRIL